jgi:opacity protein-like surface antigen
VWQCQPKRNGRSCPFFSLRETNLHKATLLSALVFLSVLSAHGQVSKGVSISTQPAARGVGPRGNFPRFEIFEGYSYLNVDTAGHPTSGRNFNGWESSATYNPSSWIGVELDVSAHDQGNCGGVTGLTCKQLSFLGGPKLAYRSSRATVFTHGLFGGDHVSSGFLGLSRAEVESALAVGGGLDYAATRQLSIRVAQVDYLLTLHARGLGGIHQNNMRVSAGVVFTLRRGR